MNKEEVYKFIKNKNIWYEITEHQAVYNMEELSSIDLPYKERDTKNIFVRDDKKKNYYLITIKGNKKVNIKDFKKKYNTRNLTFAFPEDLKNILNLTPGSVSPLGLLNDKEHKVVFYIDKELLNENGIIGVHPNDNTATIWLKTNNLIDIIKEHKNLVNIVEL